MSALWTKPTAEIILIILFLFLCLIGVSYLIIFLTKKINIKRIKKGDSEIILNDDPIPLSTNKGEHTKTSCATCNNSNVIISNINTTTDTVIELMYLLLYEVRNAQMTYAHQRIEEAASVIQKFMKELIYSKTLSDLDKKLSIEKFEAETELMIERVYLTFIRNTLKYNHIPDPNSQLEQFNNYLTEKNRGIFIPIRQYLKEKNFENIISIDELDEIINKWKPILYKAIEDTYVEAKRKYDQKLKEAKSIEEHGLNNIKIVSGISLEGFAGVFKNESV